MNRIEEVSFNSGIYELEKHALACNTSTLASVCSDHRVRIPARTNSCARGVSCYQFSSPVVCEVKHCLMYAMMTRAAIYPSTATPMVPMVKRIRNQAYGDLKMGQVSTPVGPLSLGATKDGLKAAYFDSWWEDQPDSADTGNEAADAMMREAKVQVQEYFAGIRKEFTIPMASDGTSFQKRAWAALEKIPYGETICYEEQAISMGEPRKARAVGAANGKNPICLFVPCHRVIAKDGGLCGFASGLKIKQYLLDLEAGRLNDSHHQAQAEL